MVIKKFVHSEKADDNRQLFSLIGEYCASVAVRDALGDAISSAPGRVWYVALEGDAVLAFVSVYTHKGCGRLWHLYAVVDKDGVWEMLLQHCIEYARKNNARWVQLVDYTSMEERFAQMGFLPRGKPRGRFSRYIRLLGRRHGD